MGIFALHQSDDGFLQGRQDRILPLDFCVFSQQFHELFAQVFFGLRQFFIHGGQFCVDCPQLLVQALFLLLTLPQRSFRADGFGDIANNADDRVESLGMKLL